MNVLFCGYRNWAIEVFDRLKTHYVNSERDVSFILARDPEALKTALDRHTFDVALVVGWSWMIEEQQLQTLSFIGMHPSDLPMYAGGSPIQNQIIDGVQHTKATLFKLQPRMDCGPIVSRCPVSLEGHLDEVFARLTQASFTMYVDVLDRWPDICYNEQEGTGSKCRRIKPCDSRLQKSSVATMTCRQIWDFIRCREDPYPNVFLEDDTGRLIIKRVEFDSK